MIRTTYLPGTPVVGFWSMFEADFGDSSTPVPYPMVRPSRVGSAMLPFICSRCSAVIDFTDPERLKKYTDTRGKYPNCWCPACGLRFYITGGRPFVGTIAQDGVAPCMVERVIHDQDGVQIERRVYGAGGVGGGAASGASTIIGTSAKVLGAAALGTSLLGMGVYGVTVLGAAAMGLTGFQKFLNYVDEKNAKVNGVSVEQQRYHEAQKRAAYDADADAATYEDSDYLLGTDVLGAGYLQDCLTMPGRLLPQNSAAF